MKIRKLLKDKNVQKNNDSRQCPQGNVSQIRSAYWKTSRWVMKCVFIDFQLRICFIRRRIQNIYKTFLFSSFRVLHHCTNSLYRFSCHRLSDNHLWSWSRISIFSYQWPQQIGTTSSRKTLPDELFRIWCRSEELTT